MKLTKRQLKRIIREEKQKLNEGQMAEQWYVCMDYLFDMALTNGYVCHLCASKAINNASNQGPADMDTCSQLIQDCIDDGMLAPIQHPVHKQVTVYAAID